jgi:hypothetical protein
VCDKKPQIVRVGGDFDDPTYTIQDEAFLAANPMSDRHNLVLFESGASSQESGESTSDLNEPDTKSSGNARSSRTGAKSSNASGPTHLAFMPYRTLLPDGEIQSGYAERAVVDALHGPTGTKEPLICSAEDSPAKTFPSPEDVPASTVSARDSSSSSHASPGLFDPPGSSLRMYPDSFPLTVAEISPLFSRRWPSSGMAFAGECWTLATSESPNDAVECSLSDILEPDPPTRSFLSSKAARGILRRAQRRGRTLPARLEAALESVAGVTTSSGGGLP